MIGDDNSEPLPSMLGTVISVDWLSKAEDEENEVAPEDDSSAGVGENTSVRGFLKDGNFIFIFSAKRACRLELCSGGCSIEKGRGIGASRRGAVGD